MDHPFLASHQPEYVFWHGHLTPWIIAIVVAVIVVTVGYANFQNAKPFRVESTTSLYPEQALDTLQATMAKDGWTLGFRDTGSLIMSIDRNADLGVTAALGCMSVWLALVHMLTSRGKITVEIDATESAAGSLLITNGSRSGNGVLRYMTHHLHNLPKNSPVQ